jgi:hypothetical protein
MHVYEPTAKVSLVSKENSSASIRAFCDANNVFDAAGYPASLASLPIISLWLQKNLAAREAAVAFFKESKNENLDEVAV